MSINVLYRTSARATGGREGRSETLDGNFSAQMSRPKEMGGTGGPGVNPEQLFAAGYAACFLGALKFAASQDGIKLSEQATVTSTVGIGPRDAGGFGLDVSLKIFIPAMPPEKAKELVDKAHEICPYSNATRNNIDVRLTLV